jgi:hypothetical protein
MPALFTNKLPGAEVVLSFSAVQWLPAGVTLTGTPTVTASVADGDDPSPTSVLNGPAVLDVTNTLVLQPVKAGLASVYYLFDVQCASSSDDWSFETQGILPVGY